MWKWNRATSLNDGTSMTTCVHSSAVPGASVGKSRGKCLNRRASFASNSESHSSTNSKTINSSILTRHPIKVRGLLAAHFTPSAAGGKHRQSIVNYPKVQHVSSIAVVNYVWWWNAKEILVQSILAPLASSSGVCRCRFSWICFYHFMLTCVCGPFRISRKRRITQWIDFITRV